MIRLKLSTWLAKLSRRRAVLPAFVLLLGAAIATGPRLWAGYHLHRASLELQRYHPQEARRHLAIYLRLRPHDVAAHLLAARAARQLEDYDDAEQHLLQAQQEQGKTSPDVVLEWTLHRATLGNLEQTELYLQSLAQTDAEEAFLAYEALVEGYRRNYRIPRALFFFDQWLKRRPDDVRALLLRGRLWMQAKRPVRAVPDYRRALELEPERDEARHGLALCLTESAQWNEAVPHWQELQRRHPADLEIRVHLARCWCRLGQEQRARQMLQTVLAERPDHPLAFRSLGRALLQEQQPAQAEIWLRRAVRAMPNDYLSYWLLYQSLQQQGKTTEAERQLDQATQLEHYWQRLSKITELELANRPYDAALHSELGILLIDLGYEEAGRNWLLSALHRDPQCRPAQEALARLSLRSGSTTSPER